MVCKLICFALATMCTMALAQDNTQELWEQFRLPSSYSGNADIVPDDPGNEVWTRVAFDVSMVSTYTVRYLQVAGVGESISQIRFGDMNESLIIYPSQQQVQRTNRFAETYTDAGESEFSPIPIIRSLQRRSSFIEVEEVARTNDGLVTLRITDPERQDSGYIEIDYKNDELVEYRSSPRGNHFVNTVTYQEWRDFPSGTHIPTKMVSRMSIPSLGEEDVVMYISLKDYKENPTGERIKPPQIPAGFTVIDHIEGVTKTDGEVIAPIQYGQPPKQSSSLPGARGKQASKLFIWLGVGFVVIAGIVLGTRVKAAR